MTGRAAGTAVERYRLGVLIVAVSIASSLVACGSANPPGPRETLGVSAPPLAEASLAVPPEAPPSVDVPPPAEDPNATLPPLPTSHAEPGLDALIDIEIRGVTLATSSLSGDAAAAGGGYLPALLDGLGKAREDLATAFAEDPARNLQLSLFALKIRGVGEQDLLNAFLDATSTHDADVVEVAGRQVRRVQGDWTSYFFMKGGAVIVVAAADAALAAEAVQAVG